ncbi:zinc finger protein 436 isoform X2 [Bombina bombina]|uniref:zinc finger protein 436 isoform X2 n=1 Tax=Bombina bombina TaxID=8345 RepID=UPI00235B1904|nr:zinc finger protein 436 isoform X2 [Bombina bombina]
MISDTKETTSTILDHALEIICLLTGEDYIVVKKPVDKSLNDGISGDVFRKTKDRPIISLEHKDTENKTIRDKIIDIANKIICLLTGKVPLKFEDIAIYFSMDEFEYLEDHKDIYKDLIMPENNICCPPGSNSINEEVAHEDNLNDNICESVGSDPTEPQSPHSQSLPKVERVFTLRSIKVEPEDHYGEGSLDSWMVQGVNGGGLCGSDVMGTESSLPAPEPNGAELNNRLSLFHVKPEPSDEDTQDSVMYEYIDKDTSQRPASPQQSEDYDVSASRSIKEEPAESYDEYSQESEMAGDNSRGQPQSVSSSDPIVEYDENACYIKVELDASSDEDSQQSGMTASSDRGFKQENMKKEKKIRNPKQMCTNCAKELKDSPHPLSGQSSDDNDDKWNPFACFICGKSLRETKKSRKSSSSKEKQFPCNLCDKKFYNNSHLKRHTKTHTGEKPFSCSSCGKAFASKPQLVIHERVHTGEKPYSCTECGRKFSCNAHVALHMVVHTGEKRYSCTVCGMGFTRNSSLLKHSSLHAEKRPHVCKVCGKGYCQYANLVVHQRIHSGEKPFVCKECGRGFTCKASMVKHERTHTGEKPYTCTECKKRFTSSNSLTKHKQLHCRDSSSSSSEETS